MIQKQIYNTKNKQKLTIDIPEKFRDRKKLLIIIDDSVNARNKKLEFMKKASNDPLFKSDVNQISKDFRNIDRESL